MHGQSTVNISYLTCPRCSATPREGQIEFTAKVFSHQQESFGFLLTCHRLHGHCKLGKVGWATPGHRGTRNARQEHHKNKQLSKAKGNKNELKIFILIVENVGAFTVTYKSYHCNKEQISVK